MVQIEPGYNARVPKSQPAECLSLLPVLEGRIVGLQIAARRAGDVAILDFAGRATIGESADLMSRELQKVLTDGSRKVLVNLALVSQIDSTGLSALVRAFVSFERCSGSLKLLRPSGNVRHVLELTRLIRSIPTFEDEAAALEAFERPAAGAH
jgi:anti-anti-sigma factor